MTKETIFGIAAYAIFVLVIGIIAGRRMKKVRKTIPRPDGVCPHASAHAYGPTVWTQDGWTRVCKFCHEWDYLGDDYDAGPKK